MKHLSLNLEALESRTLFSVTAGDVVIGPDVPPTDGGADPQRSPAAYDAFLKIGKSSAERALEFFSKSSEAADDQGRAWDAFLKIGENAAQRSADMFLKIEPRK